MAHLGTSIGRTDWFKGFEQLGPNMSTLLTGLAIPMAVRKKDRLLLFNEYKKEDGETSFNVMYVNKRFVELYIQTTTCACCQGVTQLEALNSTMEDVAANDEAPLRIPIMIRTSDNMLTLGARIPESVTIDAGDVDNGTDEEEEKETEEAATAAGENDESKQAS